MFSSSVGQLRLTRPLLLLLVLVTISVCGVTSQRQPTQQRSFTKLTRDMSQLKLLATKAYNNFEIVKRHKGPFTKVITDLRAHRQRLKSVTGQIHSALAKISLFSFIERMILQFHRIQSEKLSDIYDWIGTELLHHYDLHDGTGEFVSLHFSEQVEISNNVAHYRFVQLISAANETNRLLVKTISQALNGTKVPGEVQSQINRRLDELIAEAMKARAELSQEYYNEVEKFIEQKRELNLLQKMQLEKLKDAFHFVANFVRAYQRMLQRLFQSSNHPNQLP